MFKTFIDNFFHMGIRQRVIDNLTLPAKFDKVCKLKSLKLMRNRRLCKLKQRGKVTDTHLMLLKSMEYADAGSVSEKLEK